jgi:hypothetical protein
VANKPDGRSLGTDRVTFTRSSAERIAKVVRDAEAGDRDQPGVSFGYRPPATGTRTFRIATFTGTWSIGGNKVVTFSNAPTATAVAVNLFAGVTASGGAKDCAVAKDGTAWYLIAARC